MTRRRVLLLGAALAGVAMHRLLAACDDAGYEVDLIDGAAIDQTPVKHDGDVLVLGGGSGYIKHEGRRSNLDALILESMEPCRCSDFDWEWDHIEANLPYPVGCSASLVRLWAVNERTMSRLRRPRVGTGANRTVKGRVWGPSLPMTSGK